MRWHGRSDEDAGRMARRGREELHTGSVLLAAGILAAIGSLGILLGAGLQAYLAWYQLTSSQRRRVPGFLFARSVGEGVKVATAFFYGWLIVLAGSLLTFTGAIVVIVAVVR